MTYCMNNKAKHNAVWADRGDELKVWADGGSIWFERPENPNTAPRFGGDAANSQERYFHVMGFEALKRRRERATSMWFKFCFGEHL